ncbi:MAG: hypothetical protein AUG00_04250 [Candidatus Rokubacteria bacterium 13_1_20CM_2_70_7]|nr:MAG: hypothetical protein AUG00_04250 [Candidatus Rokubacteria bacterium 13_1_20CM_2_70_7]
MMIPQLVAARAAEAPDAPAVISDSGVLTYGELDRRANRLAHHLQALRVGPATLVALALERSLGLVVGALGVLKSGGAGDRGANRRATAGRALARDRAR